MGVCEGFARSGVYQGRMSPSDERWPSPSKDSFRQRAPERPDLAAREGNRGGGGAVRMGGGAGGFAVAAGSGVGVLGDPISGAPEAVGAPLGGSRSSRSRSKDCQVSASGSGGSSTSSLRRVQVRCCFDDLF